MKLVMIECPKCGNDFPEKRKELGYHVCVSCSTVKPKVGVTTVEGTGDHTYNDIIIMEQDTYISIKKITLFYFLQKLKASYLFHFLRKRFVETVYMNS